MKALETLRSILDQAAMPPNHARNIHHHAMYIRCDLDGEHDVFLLVHEDLNELFHHSCMSVHIWLIVVVTSLHALLVELEESIPDTNKRVFHVSPYQMRA